MQQVWVGYAALGPNVGVSVTAMIKAIATTAIAATLTAGVPLSQRAPRLPSNGAERLSEFAPRELASALREKDIKRSSQRVRYRERVRNSLTTANRRLRRKLGAKIGRDFAERFRREADLTASLWHPHIVGVHDRGEFDGRLWISMDFVDGTDAARLLADSGALPALDVVAIVDAVADALDFAHQRGLLHRDVKPANILMTAGAPQRRILLADFGIGRDIAHTSGLTATNMTVGTVSYAAPEQLMGESIDGRADQYALGATAYHLLTSHPVFDHSNPAVVISRHLNAAPPACQTGVLNSRPWTVS